MRRRARAPGACRGPWIGRTALAAIAVLAVGPVGAQHEAGSKDPLQAREYEVKAAFLYNFTKFVAWPGRRPADTVQVTVYGSEDPFGSSLRELLRSTSGGGSRFELARAHSLDDAQLDSSDVVFVTRSARSDAAAIVDKFAGRPVLIVADSEGLIEEGVTINLVLEGRKVRFDVNLESARAGELRLSSQLLRLARRVLDSQEVADAR